MPTWRISPHFSALEKKPKLFLIFFNFTGRLTKNKLFFSYEAWRLGHQSIRRQISRQSFRAFFSKKFFNKCFFWKPIRNFNPADWLTNLQSGRWNKTDVLNGRSVTARNYRKKKKKNFFFQRFFDGVEKEDDCWKIKPFPPRLKKEPEMKGEIWNVFVVFVFFKVCQLANLGKTVTRKKRRKHGCWLSSLVPLSPSFLPSPPCFANEL